MNNTINKLLLAGDKFMPEMHLRQPQFTYSACGPFTKHKQRIQKFKETGDTNYIYKNELDKACFVHDAAYSDSKDLIKDGYQRGLASMVYNFFNSKVALPDKKSVGSGAKLIPQTFKMSPRHLKYWVGVQRGQSYLMGRRCLFSLGWPPF